MRALLLALAVAFLPLPGEAATVGERFSEGLASYKAGRFEEAATAFRDLNERFGVASADLFVALGAAEFQAGHPGRALVAFHKAIRVEPSSAGAEVAAVDLARARAGLNERGTRGTEGFVFGPFHDAWTALFGWIHPGWAAWGFVGLWTVLFFSLAARRWPAAPARARRMAAIASIAAAVLVVPSGIAAYGSDRVASYRIGVVLADGTPLYPDAASTDAALRLPEGLEVRVVEHRAGFARIRLGSGMEGYVPAKSVEIP
jgi:tetratricopeptide (TPR) repeat protein